MSLGNAVILFLGNLALFVLWVQLIYKGYVRRCPHCGKSRF